MKAFAFSVENNYSSQQNKRLVTLNGSKCKKTPKPSDDIRRKIQHQHWKCIRIIVDEMERQCGQCTDEYRHPKYHADKKSNATHWKTQFSCVIHNIFNKFFLHSLFFGGFLLQQIFSFLFIRILQKYLCNTSFAWYRLQILFRGVFWAEIFFIGVTFLHQEMELPGFHLN